MYQMRFERVNIMKGLKEVLEEKQNELLLTYLIALFAVLIIHKYTYIGLYCFCFYLGAVCVDFGRYTIARYRLMKQFEMYEGE